VGKTLVQVWAFSSIQKHPHERGEDTSEKPSKLAKLETPPRAWGRRQG